MASQRVSLREQVLREAGGLGYDEIEGEFTHLARQLNWPRSATLKDLRHLFSTSLANAGMPEPYRQYLMGHAPSEAPIMSYTHLNKIGEEYRRALTGELAPVFAVLEARSCHLMAPAPRSPSPATV